MSLYYFAPCVMVNDANHFVFDFNLNQQGLRNLGTIVQMKQLDFSNVRNRIMTSSLQRLNHTRNVQFNGQRREFSQSDTITICMYLILKKYFAL